MSFTTPPPTPFTQALYGVQSNFLGGVAFAPNGDPLVTNCASAGSPLNRFASATTITVNGTSTLHPVATEASNAGCGLTNHPNGSLYTNTTLGVVQLDANTGAQIGGPFGAGGNALGIAVDPQAGNNLAYVLANGNIGFVDPVSAASGTLSTVTSGSVDQITYDKSGDFLFVSNDGADTLTILRRNGTLVQNVPLMVGSGPDGIAFHETFADFVVTNNNDGTITRFDFPGGDFTMTPSQSLFASGGFRGDNAQVGPDKCLYVTQNGTRYDDGSVTGENSLVKICPGFVTQPGVGKDVPVTTTCTRTLTGTIAGSVVVASGTTCFNKATVKGAVVVQKGAAVSVLDSTLNGSLTSIGATGVTICNSGIAFALTVNNSTGFVLIGDGGDGAGVCPGNTVGGSVVLEGQTGGLELGGNTIAGMVLVQANTAPGTPAGSPTEDAATEIEANNLKSNLGCLGNTPAPVNDGRVNNVSGSRFGQCTGGF